MIPSKSSQNLGLDDSAESLLYWLRSHGRQVGLGVIAVAAIVAVVYFVRSSNEAKEVAASRALVTAQRSVGSGNLPLAVADLQRLITQYGSTRAGVEGRVLLAQVQLQQAKGDSALATLDQIRSAGVMESSVHALKGAALEQLGRPAEAAAEYLLASSSTQLGAEGESYKADAARAYLAAGNRAEAIRIWEGIASNASSVLYSEAQLRLGELTSSSASK